MFMLSIVHCKWPPPPHTRIHIHTHMKHVGRIFCHHSIEHAQGVWIHWISNHRQLKMGCPAGVGCWANPSPYKIRLLWKFILHLRLEQILWINNLRYRIWTGESNMEHKKSVQDNYWQYHKLDLVGLQEVRNQQENAHFSMERRIRTMNSVQVSFFITELYQQFRGLTNRSLVLYHCSEHSCHNKV
jgi:hypothetical protein